MLIDWNDSALSSQFYTGLKDSLKDDLSKVTKPSSLNKLIQIAIRLDNRDHERRLERGHAVSKTAHSDQSTKQASSAASRPFTRTFTRTQTQVQSNESRSPLSMSVQKTSTLRNGKLTPEEYQRRKDNKLCLYCREFGHNAEKCPKSSTKRTASSPDSLKANATFTLTSENNKATQQ